MSEPSEPVASPHATTLTPYEAEATATLGYLYGYPLVLMDVSRASWPVPANRFSHAKEFPDDTFTDVVSANVDTLYSTAWLDLAEEPIVLGVPDVGRRYYMMQLLDAWTNVLAAPGTRTTGNGKGAFAIIGPDWRGELPFGLEPIRSPTNMVFLVGRTYTAGKHDYEAVHAIQREYQLVPLGAWGNAAERAPSVPLGSTAEPPVSQVDKLAAGPFFARLAAAMKGNPPAENDEPLVRRLGALGIAPGAAFDLGRLPPSIVDAIEAGVAAARARLRGAATVSLGVPANGWHVQTEIGRYGTNYELRAVVALTALGANLPEDAVYPMADVDASGQPLSGEHRYRVRFSPGELPPVKGFWSLTIYDDKHFLVANPLGRHALGDRDALRAAPDGTLDLLIQHDDPGPSLRANWLPAPAGAFNLIMRLYFPKPAVLDRRWKPPPVERS